VQFHNWYVILSLKLYFIFTTNEYIISFNELLKHHWTVFQSINQSINQFTLKCKLSPPTKTRFTLWFCPIRIKSQIKKNRSHSSTRVQESQNLDLKMCEPKPSIICQQCVVYNYKCDLCDAEYVGYTSWHLHQRIDEHRYSAIGKHLKNDHGLETIGDLTNNFSVLKKCNGKLDCLIYARGARAGQIFMMFFLKKIRPCLNTQSDSKRAKLLI